MNLKKVGGVRPGCSGQKGCLTAWCVLGRKGGQDGGRLDRLVPEGLGSPLWLLSYPPPTFSALIARLETAGATIAFSLGCLSIIPASDGGH